MTIEECNQLALKDRLLILLLEKIERHLARIADQVND